MSGRVEAFSFNACSFMEITNFRAYCMLTISKQISESIQTFGIVPTFWNRSEISL